MSTLVLAMALVPVALAVTAPTASATTALANDRVAVESLTFGGAGLISIAAVVLGVGGLVVGLLRHRRRGFGPATVVLPVDTTGSLPVLDATKPTEPITGDRVA